MLGCVSAEQGVPIFGVCVRGPNYGADSVGRWMGERLNVEWMSLYSPQVHALVARQPLCGTPQTIPKLLFPL